MPAPTKPEPSIADGRLLKGAQRRQTVLDATLALIGRSGLASVSQRAVAAEAGVPPSVVQYYYAAMSDLITATLAAVNDRYITDLEALPDGARGVDALAALICGYAAKDHNSLVAENELWLLAARDPTLTHEWTRWHEALSRTAARLVGNDGLAREMLITIYSGLYVRAATEPNLKRRTVAALLRQVVASAHDHG